MFDRIAAIFLQCMLALAATCGAAQTFDTQTAVFCKTRAPFDTRDCQSRQVKLPHHFDAASTGTTYGLYRFELPRPPTGVYGIFVNRLTLDGAVKVDGRALIDRLDPERQSRQRYWPLMAQFSVDGSRTDPLVIEVAVRSVPGGKVGLGELSLGKLATIENRYREALFFSVLMIAMLAATSLLAGVIGMLIGEPRDREAHLLVVTSWLAIIAGLRSLQNLVTDPPIDMVLWLKFSLWMLAMAGLLGLYVAITHIEKNRDFRKSLVWIALAIAAIFALPVTLVDQLLVINVVFGALTLVGAVVFVRLALYVRRKPDALGIYILGVFSFAAITGLHDFLVHLGDASVSNEYLQSWSLPAVIVFAVLILTRRTSRQRTMERQLQRETRRREELLRDLHDRVGSRLVALAFHAQQRDQDSAFVEEIKALINEVRMIQSAVSTEATTLEALLADLRHLYSRIGGGKLPLRWEIAEESNPVRLSADQALAVVRIIEESIANAIKHASPSNITLKLSRSQVDESAQFEVGDDGEGEFSAGSTGGLANMKIRAGEAGLSMELVQAAADQSRYKAVRIRFPNTSRSAPRWWRRWRGQR